MAYFITLNGVKVTGLYDDEVFSPLINAVAVSNEIGDTLRSCKELGAYTYENGLLALSAPSLSLMDFQNAHDAFINAPAIARRYRDFSTFAMRAGFPGPYHDEAVVYATWMDTCNQLGYQILGEVQAGTRSIPTTIEEYLNLLPICPLGV